MSDPPVRSTCCVEESSSRAARSGHRGRSARGFKRLAITTRRGQGIVRSRFIPRDSAIGSRVRPTVRALQPVRSDCRAGILCGPARQLYRAESCDWFGLCGFKMPRDMNVALSSAKLQYRFVELTGRQTWTISTAGENRVLELLESPGRNGVYALRIVLSLPSPPIKHPANSPSTVITNLAALASIKTGSAQNLAAARVAAYSLGT